MNNKHTLLPLAVLVASLSACTPPQKNIPGLTSEMDVATAGPYGQAIYHEQLANQKMAEANHVLKHWQNDHYWNIDENQKAMDAAKSASKHRLESEKALCQWLTAVHGQNHDRNQPTGETAQHAAAYFKTGSSVPYRTDDAAIRTLGKFLQAHPEAKSDVIAYADTVGKTASNQALSERRANTVSQMLIAHGAQPQQLNVKAMGEADGPDNSPNQHHRVVTISTVLAEKAGYADCPNLK